MPTAKAWDGNVSKTRDECIYICNGVSTNIYVRQL